MTAVGLQGVPATKLWMAGTSICVLALAYTGQYRPYLTRLRVVPQLTQRYEFWRLATTQLAFATTGELLLALLLVYQLRVVERLFGTRRHAAFLFVGALVGQTLNLGLLLLARWVVWPQANAVASGPYALVFAWLYQFYAHVPAKPFVRLLGVPVSTKWPVYVTAAYLLALRLPTSGVPALAGLCAGCVYARGVAGLDMWRFPRWVERVAGRFVRPLVDGGPLRWASAPRATPRQLAAVRNSVRTPPPASSDLVDQLQRMFPAVGREQAQQALEMAGNDADRAVTILLDSTTA